MLGKRGKCKRRKREKHCFKGIKGKINNGIPVGAGF
jgi:hypothetical protein